jgi:asparagine synthase (glutamine-hydrolysing)
MCGICGSTHDPTGALSRRMNDAMKHRGPDDEGLYVDEAAGVSLGARRLSVIDPEGGHQPLSNERGTVWAVLNGEIYNHPSLRRRLRDGGHRLATMTDTEVLVHLYEDYGSALVHALEGMFAFAIWDADAGRLLLARDRFGEKPLFYSERPDGLAFASELSALSRGVSHSGELDPAAVDSYFVLGYVPAPRSILAGTRQLAPGTMMEWRRGSSRPAITRYWRPPRPSAVAEPFDTAVEEFSRLLTRSVRARLVADVPVGVFLSGGVDSTLVTALASRHSSRQLKTFSVGYDVGGTSETDVARATAARLGTDHAEVVLGEHDVAPMLGDVVGRLDQPLADQALLAMHAVAVLAREQVTVAIGGEGSDELFGGYPRYRWLARAARTDLLPERLGEGVGRMLRGIRRDPRFSRLATVFDPQSDAARHLAWTTGGRVALRRRLYGPRLGEFTDADHAASLERRMAPVAGMDVAAQLMWLDQTMWLPDDVLAKADRAGMMASLEVRTPFLHVELAEFAASIPSRTHLKGRGKSLPRALLARVLPDAAKRPKRPFAVPAREWLAGPLRPLLLKQERNGSLLAEGWVDRREFSRLVSAHLGGLEDNTDGLWPVLVLGIWLDALRGAT